MYNKETVRTLSVAIVASVLAAASPGEAGDNSGNYTGGFVVPRSSAVNPAYHPRWFPGYAARNNSAGEAFGYSAPRIKIVRPATSAARQQDDYGSEAGKD